MRSSCQLSWKSWSTGLHFLSYWPFLKWTDGPYGFRRTCRPPVTLVKVVDVDVGDEELVSNCIIFAGSIWQDIQQEFRVAGFRYSMPRKEDWLSIGRSFAPQFSEWAGKFCDDCMSIPFIPFHSSAHLIQFVIAFPVAKSSRAMHIHASQRANSINPRVDLQRSTFYVGEDGRSLQKALQYHEILLSCNPHRSHSWTYPGLLASTDGMEVPEHECCFADQPSFSPSISHLIIHTCMLVSFKKTLLAYLGVTRTWKSLYLV